jgi:hypothetical protein
MPFCNGVQNAANARLGKLRQDYSFVTTIYERSLEQFHAAPAKIGWTQPDE